MPNTSDSLQQTGGIPVITLEMEASGLQPVAVDKTLSHPDQAADAKAAGDRIADVQEAIMDVSADVSDIKAWTGEDIPLTDDVDSPTIADAVTAMMTETYPVGTIYMTSSDSAPTFDGTWVEIAITATWNQLKTGKRDYAQLATGETGGTVHFWMRTA